MKRVLWHVLTGVLVLSGVVAAATLNDFKEAVGKESCESIPYESIRRTCNDKGREVDDWCKRSDRKVSCDDLDPSGLLKQIENVKGKIATLKTEGDALEAAARAETDDAKRRELEDKKKAKDNEIYEKEKLVSEWETRLSNEKREVDNRIYNGERCVGFREDVAKAFADATTSANSENDPEIKPYAEKLIRKWIDGVPGHVKAIESYKTAVKNCKGMK